MLPMLEKEYCVAIRTLGTAGEKYQQLLDSIQTQTFSPRRILVYIPYGYPTPKETIGIEQIIRCEKGMVAQRSLPLKEVDTDFILFCDDDMFLPPSLVENMFKAMEESESDCIVPNCYPLHKMRSITKMLVWLYNSASPRKDDGWAIKVKKDAGFSYNCYPKKDVLPTQTASFACFLCRTSAYHAIHFEDERWLDTFSFASYDDQLFFYKLYLGGFKICLYYNSGIIHLDARVGVRIDNTRRMFFKTKLLVILWYRTIYKLNVNSKSDRIQIVLAFCSRMLIGIIPLLGDILRYRKLNYLIDYFKGIIDGYKYVHSEEYLQIPPFDNYIN